jgi:hypothetical protein
MGGLMNLFRWSAVLAIASAAVSCRNDVQPDQSIRGNYVLDSVTGRGPATGSLSFVVTGQVIRKVRYTQADGSLSAEYVAIGTFSNSGTNAIEFNLRENGGSSPYVWTVSGMMDQGMLSLRYPDPADGWIIERYRPE